MKLQKLSKYMAIGISLRPRQAKGQLLGYRGASCALGALAEGFTGGKLSKDTIDDAVSEVVKAYQPLMDTARDCPVTTCDYINDVADLITHLNDYHYWKRERIGNWLDKVAPKRKASVRAKRAATVKPTTATKRKAAAGQTPTISERAGITEPTGAEEREEELVCI